MDNASFSLDTLLGSPLPFLDKLFAALAQDGVEVSGYELDHICYRVDELKRYEELKIALGHLGDLLGENQIGGRPIATFHLYQPLSYQGREIFLVELPAPKSGSYYPEGYEHVEFVIDVSFQDFLDRYPELPFKTKGIAKPVNADIQLQYEGFGVKFHRQSLSDVIRHPGP